MTSIKYVGRHLKKLKIRDALRGKGCVEGGIGPRLGGVRQGMLARPLGIFHSEAPLLREPAYPGHLM
jgi:hypothetical protein